MSGTRDESAEFEQPAKPITCRWDDCGKVFYDPEVVYKHLCDDHVGRKSTNNLCLTCKWEGCDVSCAKRDHITSHIRVHTPLKPHNCDVCGKTFKRPQDLKKHERIHTEQHQQQRQHKAAQNAAARAYSMSDHASSFGAYPYSSMHSANSYLGYPAVPAQQNLYPSASAYPPAYPQPPISDYARDHYAHSTSSASLSPMSSRIDTPQGSSPGPNQHGMDGGSYVHLASGFDSRSKVTTDPTSYTYLAHGATTSHNLAGSKRGHEQVEDFFGDLRGKRMAPAYDANMADRLNQTFGLGGIDDVSLDAILSTFDTSAAYPQAPVNAAVNAAVKTETTSAPRTQVKQEPADLAQLNAFLLQLGASAASTLGSNANGFSSSLASSSFSQNAGAEFDLSSLSQYGLTNIPGFDAGLLQNANAVQRSIAQLPSRAQGHHNYSPDTSSYSTSSHHMHQPSFDSVRVSRGPAIVPQLAPMDAAGHSYRRVEALTRAAPDRVDTFRADSHRTPTKTEEEDDAMEEDELDEDMSQVDFARSASPTASSESGLSEAVGRRGSSSPSHGLYPRVSPSEASRRLPPIRSNSSASTSASISSLLDTDRRVPSLRRDSTPFDGPSRYSAPSSPPSSSSSSSSTSLYPGLVDRVSKMQGLGRPVGRSPSASSFDGTSEAMRREHVRLIRDLLFAINFPERARAKLQAEHGHEHDRVRLPPILTASLARDQLDEDGEITPSADTQQESRARREGSDFSSTPTPPGRPTLPTLKQLLNDMPPEHDRRGEWESRPMREREMECDV